MTKAAHLVKGSAAAKAFMHKLRSMQGHSRGGAKRFMQMGVANTNARKMLRKALKQQHPRREKTGSMWQVYHGYRRKTPSGLKQQDLEQNKRGRIVSASQSYAGWKAFKKNKPYMLKVSKAPRANKRVVFGDDGTPSRRDF